MKNSIKLIFVTSLFLILFCGCGKKELGQFLLDGLKSQNPYSGTETLCFIDNNNDSILFYGNGRFSEIFEYKPDPGRDDYYVNERDQCFFLSDSENYNGNNIQYELKIHMITYKSSVALMTLLLTLKNTSNGDGCMSYTRDFSLPLVDHYRNSHLFIDSLKVLDTYYEDVIVDSSLLYQKKLNGNCLDPNTPRVIFYTTSYGIIKIDFNNGNVWNLKSIIR